MASTVSLKDGLRFMGQVTVFDVEPSFQVLQLAFPEARSWTWRSRDNRFTVDVGDAALIAYAG